MSDEIANKLLIRDTYLKLNELYAILVFNGLNEESKELKKVRKELLKISKKVGAIFNTIDKRQNSELNKELNKVE